MPPTEALTEEARASNSFTALLGRPAENRGSVGMALRCVASRDLPAGTLVLSDVPGAAPPPGSAAVVALRPQARVTIAEGHELAGQSGTVLTLRPKDRVPMVRLDEGALVAVPAVQLVVEAAQPAAAAADDAKRRQVL